MNSEIETSASERPITSVLPVEQVYRLVLREWRIFAVTVVAFLCMAVVIYLVTTPVYEATLVMVPNSFQPAEGNTQSSSLASSLTSLIGVGTGGAKVDDYQRFQLLLNSQKVGADLLTDKRIAHTIYGIGGPTDAPTLRERLRSLLGLGNRPPTAETMAQYVKRELVQSPATERLVLQLSYRSPDPDFARYFVMKAQQLADDEARRSDTLKYQQYRVYLEKTLAGTTGVQNHEVLTQLLTNVQQKLMLLTTNLPYSAEILDGPRVSDGPVAPSLIKNLAIALVISIFFAFGLVIFKGMHPALYMRLNPGNSRTRRDSRVRDPGTAWR